MSVKRILFRRIGGRLIPIRSAPDVVAHSKRAAKQIQRVSELADRSASKIQALYSFVSKAAPLEMGGLYGIGVNKAVAAIPKRKLAKDVLLGVKHTEENRNVLASAMKKIREEATIVRKAMRDSRNRPHASSHRRGVTPEEIHNLSTTIFKKKRF